MTRSRFTAVGVNWGSGGGSTECIGSVGNGHDAENQILGMDGKILFET